MDASTGNYAAMAIMMALLARERTGRGQRIDLTMLQAGTSVQATRIGEYFATGEQPPILGSAVANMAPSEAFLCEAGSYVGVQAATLTQWRSLCAALGLDDLAADESLSTIAGRGAARERISSRLAEVFKTKPARWWQLKLGKAQVPCARIMTFEELIQHPQVTQNHYIEKVTTRPYGDVYAAGLPWTFDRTPASILPTEAAGAHTGEILDELAKIDLPVGAQP
jgi:crotonobetainyl-CoA:carnitine CoA-transferase CaiB-like acyl-CoA transferase